VALALAGSGARVAIHGRDSERAAAVAALADGEVRAFEPAAGAWDVLVNATPIGTAPRTEESPLPDGPFTGRLVYDLVYNPPETRLLRDAAAAGCEVLGGLEMLVAQAQAQRAFWTGRPSEAAVMRAAALRHLQQHGTTAGVAGSAAGRAR
jgi:shikimate 5-dehydrogenase